METLEHVFHSIEEENEKNEKLIKKNIRFVFNHDDNHNNKVMDIINESKTIINAINESYIRVFEMLQFTFGIDVKHLTDQNRLILNKVFDTLNKLNKHTAQFFSELSNQEFLRKGCKSDLLDLRINIRNLRETIGDLEYKLVDKDEEANELLDSLMTQF